jgi:hypothetical protein
MQNEKKKAVEFIMPTKENYSILLSQNYTIKQLKEVASHHKIKLGGASIKADIIYKIYNYFKLYDSAVVIQKTWRNHLFRQYNQLRGPARLKRSICVNETDFFTMDNLTDIPYNQFFSFKDSDNMIYGFDIISIYNLFDKSNGKVANPYNRNPLPRIVKKNMMKLIWLSKLFNETIQLKMAEDNDNDNDNHEELVMTADNRAIELFHDIDILGNYTNPNWFLSLNQLELEDFIFELNDLWVYRLGLTDDVRRNICPDYFDLFRMIHVIDIKNAPLNVSREICLDIMEQFARNGINREYRILGSNYVLCALTLVSASAAEALPWLYNSVI